ncbi:uncharacterized protein PAC_04853 [Phialocephala subalpina]|uniref:BTB domain-containing protein n=1 Tax=Phialocephala subalpina TaxID=576137 RepID=A0A1L7WQC9_9HELO|nr:uncharacterized protein PAC_04853 [Phialocephala subalpina]
MSSSFETIVLSRLFKFIIGADKVPIVVHEQALADLSTALTTLMQGKMSESLAGEATWKDVDQETFIRFIQFAYTGDYSVPVMIVKASDQSLRHDTNEWPAAEAVEESVEEQPAEVASNGWGSFGRSKKQILRDRSKAFKSLTYTLLKPRSNFAHTCDPAVSEGSNENIGEVLLTHASLYVLAEKWGVESLKRLTLVKLHQTLSMLQLDGPKVTNIIKLARYVYSEENTPDLNTGIDELRRLICQYVAANAEVISEHPLFIKMIEEGGAFIRDLWKCVVPMYLTN